MKHRYVLAASPVWDDGIKSRLEQRVDGVFTLITEKRDLTVERLDGVNPDFVFFPHWSHLISEDIFTRFQCVVFHMTDLPFGRGGSPLQNLISRGIHETKISALKCTRGLDQGPVYMKRALSLHGDAEEIYIRAFRIIEEMIADIIRIRPRPMDQEGKAVVFPRRTPEQSNMAGLKTLEQVYDHIRMLDARGYPRAFFNLDGFCLKFSRAQLKKNQIKADVSIVLRADE